MGKPEACIELGSVKCITIDPQAVSHVLLLPQPLPPGLGSARFGLTRPSPPIVATNQLSSDSGMKLPLLPAPAPTLLLLALEAGDSPIAQGSRQCGCADDNVAGAGSGCVERRDRLAAAGLSGDCESILTLPGLRPIAPGLGRDGVPFNEADRLG